MFRRISVVCTLLMLSAKVATAQTCSISTTGALPQSCSVSATVAMNMPSLLQLTMDEVQSTRRSNFSTRRFNVDVLVHHRGLEPLQASKISVLLLIRKLTEAEAAWPGLPISAVRKKPTGFTTCTWLGSIRRAKSSRSKWPRSRPTQASS